MAETNKKEENFYEILGVDKSASIADINKAYLNLAKDLHPDKLPLESGQHLRKLAEERLKLVNEAYATLKDEKLRVEYDENVFGHTSNNVYAPEQITIDDLLSPEILKEGISLLQEEEKNLYLELICNVDKVESDFESYLNLVKRHKKRTLSTDTFLMRIVRLLRFIGLLIILFITFYFLIFLWIKLMSMLTGDNIGDDFASILSAIFSLIANIYILIIDKNLDSDSSQKINNEYIVFSEEIIEYCHNYKVLFSEVKLSKLISPLYKPNYVEPIRTLKKDFDDKLKELTSAREKIIKKFMTLEPYHITPKRIIDLSPSERFLLVTALERKYKQEADNKKWDQALKVAGGIGLLAIIIGTGGGFGG
ncbi:J domain-containing protein [Calothrix membranacea FACHB-236]|nr:J domain-containing protein [Calothrix membranacea FACHB-236]